MDRELIVFASLFAAFVAGVFSTLTLINTKEQKISEFRQDWIDSLRSEISTLVASIYFISNYFSYDSEESKRDKKEDAKNIEDAHRDYCKSCTAILTRINAQEPDGESKDINEEFLNSLNNIQNSFNKSDYNRASILTKKLIDSSKPLLKAEWKRVKDGEASYKKAKSIASYVTISMLSLSAIFIILNISLYVSKNINF